MYKDMQAPVLESVDDAKVALTSVNIDAILNNLLGEVTIRQTYENIENKNIEAVYTFPLPIHAVLLDMRIKIGARELKGVVVEKSEAEEKYEDAITDGDTAIMLERLETGLYTMNVGNLMPNEKVEISFTYAELYRWQNSSLRFFMPTTIAPKYGDPESVCIEPHQIPEHSLTKDNPFQIRLTIHGLLQDASLKSPSHKIEIQKDPGATIINLADREALMDRDFILNIHSDSTEKNFAIIDKDIDGYAVLTSFNPKFPAVTKKSPRSIKIVVDCSGSMGGDSITQARNALEEITNLLRPQDYFNIIKFGSDYEMLFKKQVQATENNLIKANQFVRSLDADMGGTEMEKALSVAIKCPSPKDISREIFLITDGEVWEGENIVNRLQDSKHRVFTVGIGSAVSEGLVRSLAEKTGGACELVFPNEEMAEKIVRHCKRIFLPKSKKVTVSCQNSTFLAIPHNINTVYDGDTVIFFSRLKEKQSGPISINYMLEDGQIFSQTTEIQDLTTDTSDSVYNNYPGTIARLATYEELKLEDDKKKIADVAVRYQLISDYTNFLVIDIRIDDQKTKNLPVLRKVPQMLAAGWGGSSTVMESRVSPMLSDSKDLWNEYEPQFGTSDMRPDYGENNYKSETDQLMEFIHSFSQRGNEHFMEFIEDLNRKRNEEQMTLGGNLFQIEPNIIDSIPDEFTESKITKSIEAMKKNMHEKYNRYMEFVEELVHYEIKEHKYFIKDCINRETENYELILKEFTQRRIFEQQQFIKKLMHYFSGSVLPTPTINELGLFGLDSDLIHNLTSLINDKNNEENVVVTFLYALLNIPSEFSMPRQMGRMIQKKYKDSPQDKNLYGKVLDILK